MPKKSNADEYVRRKISNLEKKIRKRKNWSRLLSSSSSDPRSYASPVPSLPQDGHELLATDSKDLTEQLGLPTQDVNLKPIPGPSTPASVSPDECALNNDILDFLGASPSKSKNMGDTIKKEIELSWQRIAASGLSKEARKDLLDRYLVPENCTKISAPQLNPKIKAGLSDTMLVKDQILETKQNLTASAISCIGKALTRILNSDQKDVSIIKPLLDCAELLCDYQFNESMERRSLICATIKKDIKSPLYGTEIDTHLFGEKLADTLKTAKATSKSGSEIKASKPKPVASRANSRNLSSKPQLAHSRQPVRRRQDSAAYFPASTETAGGSTPPAVPPQQRNYPTTATAPPPPLLSLLPPAPPSLPSPPPQRSRQRRMRR